MNNILFTHNIFHIFNDTKDEGLQIKCYIECKTFVISLQL